MNYNLYSKKVMDHFKNPHNYGQIKNPDGIGRVGNVVCGDVLVFYLRIDKNEIIKNIKFETFGCAAAISTSSIITDLVKGKSIKEALKIDNKKVIEALGGLPSIKVHCSLLGIDALLEAIYDYLIKNNKELPKEVKERHQKISKSKKQIEKKYQKWIK